GYDAFSLDNNRITLSDEPGFDRQDSNYVSMKSKWSGENYEITGILGAANSDIGYGYDEDWSFTGIHPFGYTSTDHYLRERKTRSAEVRINTLSEFGWVAGIYYFDSNEDLVREYTFLANNFSSTYEFKSYAVFAESEIELLEGTSLSVGMRFEKRETSYEDSEGIEFSPSENFWGGEISLKKDLYDNFLAYTSVARGFKAGGFNIDGTLDGDLREFDEEYLIEYEAGFKGSLFENNLQLRLAIFKDDRKDQQVKSSIVRPRPDGSTEFIDFLGNAAEGTNKGLETSISWEINPNWRLTFDAGLLKATFDQYTNEFGENLSGRDQAHAPRYMASAGIRFSHGRWKATLTADTKDEFYFSDRHGVKSERATLANFSIVYFSAPWQIKLWARNLGDQDYQTRGFGSFGNDPRKLYITEPYYQLGEPRIAGVTFQFFMRD
ncbi:MAG: TonB-dependent receptor, partial [Pseudomonadota bacterium]|nr:TonB-dependent receptor [Pseudomonadota bacterium]